MLYIIPTFTATSDEVLIQSAKARMYHVRPLGDSLELAYEATMLKVPHVYTLTRIYTHTYKGIYIVQIQHANTPICTEAYDLYYITPPNLHLASSEQ